MNNWKYIHNFLIHSLWIKNINKIFYFLNFRKDKKWTPLSNAQRLSKFLSLPKKSKKVAPISDPNKSWRISFLDFIECLSRIYGIFLSYDNNLKN